jgi:membrane protein required for colicin V production
VNLNWLDITLIVIVGISVADGVVRGFARSGIGLVAAIAGIVLGIWFYGIVAYFFLPYVSSEGIANIIGFLLVFFGCLVAGALLGKLLAALFKWVGLSWLDRMLGALFGLLRGGAMAIAIILAILAFAPNRPPGSIVGSHYSAYLMDAARFCASLAPRELRDDFYEGYDQVRELWREAVSDRRSAEAEI